MQLDDARLTALCGNADGCKVTLGATQYRYSSAVQVSGPVPVTGGSCRFFLDPPTGRWAVEEGCSIYYATKQYGTGGWALTPGYYARYYSSVTGTSGTDDPGRVVVVSSIDNLLKGAASQAVQNLNLMLGLPERTALEPAPGVSP
jgi:hypothetical protein